MTEVAIDRLARAVALRRSRRQILAAAVGAAGAAVATSLPAGAQSCTSDSGCQSPFTCQAGFCQAPGCTQDGLTCSAHTDCCEGSICQNGVCGVSVRCGREDELCGNGCCPGLECTGGYCLPEAPAPPEETGGGNGSTGGGNNGGGGNTGGGGGGGNTGGSSGGGSGTTSGGVSVASLPSTGHGIENGQQWSSTLTALAGAAGLTALAKSVRDRIGKDVSGPAN